MYCILQNVKRGSFSVVLMRVGWFISTVLHSELSVSHVFMRKRDGVRKRGTKKSKIIQLNSHPPDTHNTPHGYNIPSYLIKYYHCPGLLLFQFINSMHFKSIIRNLKNIFLIKNQNYKVLVHVIFVNYC